jgi:endoglucanase
VGEAAAALAATSIAFKKVVPKYSALCLTHAKSLYTFANTYRNTYTVEIPDAINYYQSYSGFGDELAWAAAWLWRATNDSFYASEVANHFAEFPSLQWNEGDFSWDQKTAGVQVLLAEITGNQTYKAMVQTFCDAMVATNTTPKGIKFNLGQFDFLLQLY